MKISNRPTYPLEDMKALVAAGKFRPTMRVMSYLKNHYTDVAPEKVVERVFESLSEDDFLKSVELTQRPGIMADVYAGGWYDDTEWYVKAFIENESITMQIWTLAWDGSNH